MVNYKIVASDLDGTLFNDRSQVSEENLQAIHALAMHDVQFVPSSGRTLCEIPNILKNNPDIRYVIHSNGAVVHDLKTGDRILNCLTRDLIAQVLDVIYDYDMHVMFRQNGGSFVDAACEFDGGDAYFNFIPAHRKVIDDYAKPLSRDEFQAYAKAQNDIEVFSMFFHDDDELEACRKRLNAIDALGVVSVCEHNLETFHVTAGKGNALYQLADKLGIDRAATICVGDSENDLSMIKAAGLGLAVANANDVMKANADVVICSNEEHAIAHIFKHFVEDQA